MAKHGIWTLVPICVCTLYYTRTHSRAVWSTINFVGSVCCDYDMSAQTMARKFSNQTAHSLVITLMESLLCGAPFHSRCWGLIFSLSSSLHSFIYSFLFRFSRFLLYSLYTQCYYTLVLLQGSFKFETIFRFGHRMNRNMKTHGTQTTTTQTHTIQIKKSFTLDVRVCVRTNELQNCSAYFGFIIQWSIEVYAFALNVCWSGCCGWVWCQRIIIIIAL